ncbi:hypothetical protein AVENP_2524 [Arcobacter venerupis]|uniref:Uncharacterized protein n=1 Tax=Arcobacter venerupis TaxID=1054033 RepID=A0AAE7E4K2_9BACT|nr:hypothetical protein AVENP_2524 [Arcobacter venerupis]
METPLFKINLPQIITVLNKTDTYSSKSIKIYQNNNKEIKKRINYTKKAEAMFKAK